MLLHRLRAGVCSCSCKLRVSVAHGSVLLQTTVVATVFFRTKVASVYNCQTVMCCVLYVSAVCLEMRVGVHTGTLSYMVAEAALYALRNCVCLQIAASCRQIACCCIGAKCAQRDVRASDIATRCAPRCPKKHDAEAKAAFALLVTAELDRAHHGPTLAHGAA